MSEALLLDLENTEQARTFGIGNKRFTKRRGWNSNVVYCDSPFEEQVVEFLENEGYPRSNANTVRVSFGSISLSRTRGRNILAIECDGAGYHSSLVARTRDRARQRVLETLGWRIHRVWSTNWWYFEEQEKEAIIAAINTARNQANLSEGSVKASHNPDRTEKSERASTERPVDRERVSNQPDTQSGQEKRITSPPFPAPKSEFPEPEPPRSPNQTQRSVETGRPPGIRVIDELRALNQQFKNPQCSGCGGQANLAVNKEGLVVVCTSDGCRKSKRVDAETLKRLADHLSVLCYSCKQGSLQSMERTYGNILRCQNPHCGANNTWQGISDRIDRS